MLKNKEIKQERIEYPDVPETPVDVHAIREKYLKQYADSYYDHAEETTRGRSTLQGNIYVLWQVRRFLEDLGLSEQVEEVHAEVQAKYPEWDGIFHTHETSGHVGGGGM